jgi:hypothetical protein
VPNLCLSPWIFPEAPATAEEGEQRTYLKLGLPPRPCALPPPSCPSSPSPRLAGGGELSTRRPQPRRGHPRGRSPPSCARASSRASARKSKNRRSRPLPVRLCSSVERRPAKDLALPSLLLILLAAPFPCSGEAALQAAHAAVSGGVTVVSWPVPCALSPLMRACSQPLSAMFASPMFLPGSPFGLGVNPSLILGASELLCFNSHS